VQTDQSEVKYYEEYLFLIKNQNLTKSFPYRQFKTKFSLCKDRERLVSSTR